MALLSSASVETLPPPPRAYVHFVGDLRPLCLQGHLSKLTGLRRVADVTPLFHLTVASRRPPDNPVTQRLFN